ncbi:MAG: Amino acid/polyamine/organocation transporter, superfamily [Gammaproteobacteria bacterium]|nr:Amino acid/polyamine/organocation transporter, superfamily [Gammaproteobacteria bacterium]
MREKQRDIGLVRVVGPWAFAASIISMIVGAGIFAVPAALAACVGTYAPFAFLACGFAVGAVAICLAEGGSRVPTSGGVYGVIEAAFGPLAGYVSGTLLWVSCVLACGAVSAALADVAASLFPPSFLGPVRAVVIIGVIGGIALVNIGGVARGARLVSATTTLKLAPLAIFILAGASAIHSSNFVPAVQPDAQGFGRAMILAVFALVGMETSLCASGEVLQPNHTIPRALIIAMLSTTLLYAAIQVIAQGILGSSLATSKAPLADAMAHIHPALRALMLAGTALSMFGWLGSDILGSPRQLFAFARDGLLPRVVGQLHPQSHAPHIAILCYATLAIVLALTGTFAELVVLSTLSVAALYIGGCAASWVLARRGVALFGMPLNFHFLGAATVIGIGGMLTLIALGSRQEIIGLVTLIGLSVLIYLVQARSALARLH